MFRKRERILRCYLKCLIDAIVKSILSLHGIIFIIMMIWCSRKGVWDVSDSATGLIVFLSSLAYTLFYSITICLYADDVNKGMYSQHNKKVYNGFRNLFALIYILVNMKSKHIYNKIKAFNKLEKLNLVYPELLVCFGYEHYVTRTGEIVIHNDYLNKVKDKLIESYESEIDKKNRKQEIEILNFIGVK